MGLGALALMARTFPRQRNKYYVITPHQRLPIGDEYRQIDTLVGSLDKLIDANSDLYSIYHDEYHECRLECTPTFDSEGGMGMDCKTECYWEDPRPLRDFGIDHSDISGWKRKAERLRSRLLNLRSAQRPFKIESHDDALIDDMYFDHTLDQIVSFLSFAVPAGLFVFYEELYDLIADEDDDFDPDYLSQRRTLFKIGALGLASIPAWMVQSEHIKENARSFEGTYNKLMEVIETHKFPDSDVFLKYLKVRPDELLYKYENNEKIPIYKKSIPGS